MKIAFVLMVHYPDDERVWYQQASDLQQAGHETFIVSTRIAVSDLPHTECFDDSAMPKRQVIARIVGFLNNIVPDILICDNPMSILAAQSYKRQTNRRARIYYDVTEWYPSKKNLRQLSRPLQVMKALTLTALSIYAACFVSGFIFGEHYKAAPFRFLFAWKPYIFLPYYANVDKIAVYPVRDIRKECILLYAGALTEEKGFQSVLQMAVESAKCFPDTQFILQLLTDPTPLCVLDLPKNLKIRLMSKLAFPDFCHETGKADLCFDLRRVDWENTRCLPIKLFYYMAAGRPVIYSNLKAIRKEVSEIETVGALVDPQHIDAVVDTVAAYINHPTRYRQHCTAARRLAEQKYDWRLLSARLIHFLARY